MTGFHCATCGTFHDELPMCLGSPAPDAWLSIPESDRSSRAARSSDQCVVDGERFFLLGQLEVPVHDSDRPFVWLTWVSVSDDDFLRASDLWDVDGRESEPPYAARVASSLPYPGGALDLAASLITQPAGERPKIVLEPSEHPLAVEQRDGIPLLRVQRFVEDALHSR